MEVKEQNVYGYPVEQCEGCPKMVLLGDVDPKIPACPVYLYPKQKWQSGGCYFNTKQTTEPVVKVINPLKGSKRKKKGR